MSIYLPAGFHGAVVGDNMYNYNSYGATNTTSTESSGGGLISFVGVSYWASGGFAYPGNNDSGPANRYDAGTFAFSAAPEPGSALVWSAVRFGLAVGGPPSPGVGRATRRPV